MSAFDIPFTKLVEPIEKPADRSPPAKRGANPIPRKKKVPVDPNAVRTPPRVTNWKTGQYTPNRAMRDALERARAAQPALIVMTGSPTDGEPKDYPK